MLTNSTININVSAIELNSSCKQCLSDIRIKQYILNNENKQ